MFGNGVGNIADLTMGSVFFTKRFKVPAGGYTQWKVGRLKGRILPQPGGNRGLPPNQRGGSDQRQS